MGPFYADEGNGLRTVTRLLGMRVSLLGPGASVAAQHEINIGGPTYALGSVSGTGVMPGSLVFANGAPAPSNYTLNWTVDGAAPTACMLQGETSPDNQHWTAVTSAQPCTATGTVAVNGQPAQYFHIKITAYTAAAGTTVKAFYTRGDNLAGGGTVDNTARTAAAAAQTAASNAAQGVATIYANGLIGQYPLIGGSGTTEFDISGAANNANWTGTPTRYAQGITTSTNASGQNNGQLHFPLAITQQAATLVWVFDYWPDLSSQAGATGGVFQIAPLIDNDSGTQFYASTYPLLWGYSHQTNAGASGNDSAMQSWYNQATQTLTYESIAGYSACVAWTLPTASDHDHLYIDGRETAYQATGASVALNRTATLNIGGDALNGYIPTNWQYFLAYGTPLTQAQVSQDCAAMKAIVAARGGTPSVGAPTTEPQFLAIGNSLTAGTGSSNGNGALQPYTYYMTPALNGKIRNFGIVSRTTEQLIADVPYKIAPLLEHSIGAGQNVCSIWEGTNSMMATAAGGSGDTPAQAYAMFRNLASSLRRAGCDKIIGVSAISRVGIDSNITAYNQLLRAGWHGFLDEFYDAGNDPSGAFAPGAYSSTTYYIADQTHLTNAGYAVIGAGVQAAYNRLLNASGAAAQTTVQLMPTSAQTCSANLAGQFQYSHGNATTKDSVQVCAQDASGTWAWRTIF